MMKIIAFFVGLYVAIRWLAACYGLVDHWYCIHETYRHVLKRLCLWSMVAWLGYFVLPSSYLWGFSCFMVGYALFMLIPTTLFYSGSKQSSQ